MVQECSEICQSTFIDLYPMVGRGGELFHLLSSLHLPVSLAIYLISMLLKALGSKNESQHHILSCHLQSLAEDLTCEGSNEALYLRVQETHRVNDWMDKREDSTMMPKITTIIDRYVRSRGHPKVKGPPRIVSTSMVFFGVKY